VLIESHARRLESRAHRRLTAATLHGTRLVTATHTRLACTEHHAVLRIVWAEEEMACEVSVEAEEEVVEHDETPCIAQPRSTHTTPTLTPQLLHRRLLLLVLLDLRCSLVLRVHVHGVAMVLARWWRRCEREGVGVEQELLLEGGREEQQATLIESDTQLGTTRLHCRLLRRALTDDIRSPHHRCETLVYEDPQIS